MANQSFPSDVTFLDLLELEHHGPDTYVGRTLGYPWGGLYGGQIVAQALRAAQLTTDPEYSVHSLHAYFIRRGSNDEPVRLEVDRIRNGRSFSTRRVVARQSGGAIFNMSCSFQKDEEAADVQIQSIPKGVPRPDDIEEDTGWGSFIERREALLEHGRSVMWVRLAQELPKDKRFHACALAFISDSVVTGVVRASHPRNVTKRTEAKEVFTSASLDHSLYFQRDIDATQWSLADIACHGLVGGRGLTMGNFFASDGTQTASVVQEVLMREQR